jgi:WD40 repeat protein
MALYSVAFTKSERYMLSGNLQARKLPGSIAVWSVETTSLIQAVAAKDAYQIAISPDGVHLATTSDLSVQLLSIHEPE